MKIKFAPEKTKGGEEAGKTSTEATANEAFKPLSELLMFLLVWKRSRVQTCGRRARGANRLSLIK